ncbi:hypothetical protein CTEN210_09985 [Chaetoceros tenuissimus]|uniref:Uncharacterized protein n=1 Tax=Chaetoceros tenuissimus TaxID=426638 RepID=A0AAD3H866_9STRA|nr:hypothetical protein CTEN210_09985 [Chaetoceros tenuissimus]
MGSPGNTGDDVAMTPDQIANLIGAIKFETIGAGEENGENMPRSKSLNIIDQKNHIGNSLHRSASLTTTNATLKVDEADDTENDEDLDVCALYLEILKSKGYEDWSFLSFEDVPEDFFTTMTQENFDGYTSEILNAVRGNDLEKLRSLNENGHCMQCCNKFGESILHLAARRGNAEVINFLLNEANISSTIKDDYGRTPIHDACWVVSTDFQIIQMFLMQCPDMLLIKDKRGFSPLQYVNKKSKSLWKRFLTENQDLLIPKRLLQ